MYDILCCDLENVFKTNSDPIIKLQNRTIR